MQKSTLARLTETFYLFSPIWAQKVMVAAYGSWWYLCRFGQGFHRLVADFKSRERWTVEQFLAYQENRLYEVLASAWRSPYYHQLFIDLGISPTMPPFEVLKSMPILSKETLRTRARDLLTDNPPPRNTRIFKSSGTTGTPTEIYYTPKFHSLELAVPEARNLNWVGVNYRDRRVMFGARKVCAYGQERPPFWRFNPMENMAYASIYHLSSRFLPYYLGFLRSYQATCIMGYPSALHTLACYALETADLPPPAKAIFTTSETVTAQAREAIEAAWKCRIYDRYGAVEGCVFASQCEYGRYHVSPDLGIVEIVDREGQPVASGKIGEVICTGLHNTLQPLIRYRIGDAASWAIDQNCLCGRSMPILENIEGRFEDICYTADGREMLRFDAVFKGVDHIREAQVVQEKVDRFIVQVVPAHGFGTSEIKKIQSNMRLHVGNVQISVVSVDAISRSPSGKFRAVICNLSSDEKNRIRQPRSVQRSSTGPSYS